MLNGVVKDRFATIVETIHPGKADLGCRRYVRASGTSTTIHPLPATDSTESPYEFVAITFAYKESSPLKLNGSSIMDASGTLHDLLLMIVGSVPSQSGDVV
jgi:hypothetical protein